MILLADVDMKIREYMKKYIVDERKSMLWAYTYPTQIYNKNLKNANKCAIRDARYRIHDARCRMPDNLMIEPRLWALCPEP